MHPFSYLRAADERAAIGEVAAMPEATFVAGGSTLIDLMKLNVMQPARLIDINALPLTKIETLAGWLRADRRDGAQQRHGLRRDHPDPLSPAFGGAPVGRIRAATQRGDAWRQYHAAHAVLLFSRYRHALQQARARIGLRGDGRHQPHPCRSRHQQQCIAAHPSDMCVALTALDAVVHVQGPKGERTIPFPEFHLLPADHPERETALDMAN